MEALFHDCRAPTCSMKWSTSVKFLVNVFSINQQESPLTNPGDIARLQTLKACVQRFGAPRQKPRKFRTATLVVPLVSAAATAPGPKEDSGASPFSPKVWKIDGHGRCWEWFLIWNGAHQEKWWDIWLFSYVFLIFLARRPTLNPSLDTSEISWCWLY